MNKTINILVVTIVVLASIFALLFLQSGKAKDVENIPSFSDQYHIAMPPMPKTMTFAGEKVPLNDWNVKERLERELLVNTYWQSNTLLMLKRTARYFKEIEVILKKNNVPDDFKYLALAESGLLQATSSSGAKGIWQFMESTAESYGLEVSHEVDQRYHLQLATEAACKYLIKSKNDVGSWTMAAAAFNRGLNGIKRDINRQGTSSYYELYLNTETSRYVSRILALKLIVENPKKYGFQLNTSDFYQPIPSYTAKTDTTISNLAEFAKQHGTTYRDLKLLNPWLIDDHLTIKTTAVYEMRLPEVLAEAADE